MSATLLGPGPSNVPEAVLAALGQPLRGHLDAQFLRVLDRCKDRLRQLFCTENPVTFPVSGTGSTGMEAVLLNSLEPGDRIVVGVNGVFGTRIANLAQRLGAEVTQVEAPWGQIVPFDELAAATRATRPQVIALVQGETSTGVLQPVQELGALAREVDALALVDCVTSLAGVPVLTDEWGLDLVYSGTQKCLNCPPGLSPVSFSDRAVERFHERSQQVPSFYLDLAEILTYVDAEGGRAYHHTAPVSMISALDAALELILDEGLEQRWQRHQDAADQLLAGLAELGIEPLVAAADRLPPLTTVEIPAGIDEADIRQQLIEDHDIEIGAGLGPLAGKVWRIGLMGINADPAIVERLLATLKTYLPAR